MQHINISGAWGMELSKRVIGIAKPYSGGKRSHCEALLAMAIIKLDSGLRWNDDRARS
jgi:hypothetical protein